MDQMPEMWQFPINCMNAGTDMMHVDYMNSNGAVSFKKRHEEDDDVDQMNENDCKRMKTAGANENQEGGGNSGKAIEENAKPFEPPKQDYIHVRSRRGQATDSHSLAERARREKIGERMKTLQDLVPGCNKVIGKALVLDEIINYVQSLQHQVEFLSMKLEAVNSRVPPSIEGFPLKDFGQQQAYDTSGLAFSTQATRDYRGTSPEWLHMQLGGGFERTT